MHVDRVDILLASYNGAKYIAEQIDSILDQTYSNWRLLVSDDGSIDETIQIVSSYIEKDSRIVLVKSRNKLGTAAGNFFGLLEYVDSPYAMFCDQDDVWDSDKIEISLKQMKRAEQEQKEKTPLLVFTDSRVVDNRLNEIFPSFVDLLSWDPKSVSFPQLVSGNVVQGSTILVNYSLVKLAIKVGLPNRKMLHDWWMALLAKIAGEMIYIDEATMSYRQHESNVVGAHKKTFAGWLKRILINPKVLRGVFERAREDVGTLVPYAQNLLFNDKIPLSDYHKKVLTEISSLPKVSLIKKITIFKKYSLISRGPVNQKIYRWLGLILL